MRDKEKKEGKWVERQGEKRREVGRETRRKKKGSGSRDKERKEGKWVERQGEKIREEVESQGEKTSEGGGWV